MNILPSPSVSPGRAVFSGGALCQDPANIAPTRPSASIDPRTCPGPRSASGAATTGGAPARGVVTAPTATGSPAAPSTTWAIPLPGGPATSSCFVRSTTAAAAASTSTPTPPTWPTPAVITPAGSSSWPSGWSSRMAYPIAPPPGRFGAIIACSSPTPRSRTGSRSGGKKAARRIETEHLDWALSDFSGYLAVDELYDGPFCVLSAVDARQQRRLLYEVLDHDPTQVDILYFLARLHDQIHARDRTVLGITTDGSPLYPEP